MLLSDLSLLLVEPSRTQQMIIRRQLEHIGIYRLDAADDAASAIEAMQGGLPDVLLSSMHLPDKTGAQLLVDLRGDERFSQLPFILISSETDLRYLEPIRQNGVTAIISKPCKEGDLKAALQRTIALINPTALELSADTLNELRVLVVDDSGVARKMIRRVLTGLGLERFTEAGDGLEAVEELDRTFFDLVVTDYNMPRMDGHALIEFIRKESSQPSVPVIMVTSEHNQTRLSAVSDAGVSAVCDKPFAPENVREILGHVLEEVAC